MDTRIKPFVTYIQHNYAVVKCHFCSKNLHPTNVEKCDLFCGEKTHHIFHSYNGRYSSGWCCSEECINMFIFQNI